MRFRYIFSFRIIIIIKLFSLNDILINIYEDDDLPTNSRKHGFLVHIV